MLIQPNRLAKPHVLCLMLTKQLMTQIGLMSPLQRAMNLMTQSERKTMYNILITLLATALVVFGSQNLDGGLLFKLALIVGGIYLGHVMTDALNENNSDNV